MQHRFILLALKALILVGAGSALAADPDSAPERAQLLLNHMSVAEKIGQMTQVNGAGGSIPDDLRAAVKMGRIGSILNEVDVDTVNELQRIAVEESPNGLPLLIGRDVTEPPRHEAATTLEDDGRPSLAG